MGREDIGVQGTAVTQVGQYVDIEHPLTCSGYIIEFYLCYYTSNVEDSPQSYHVYFRVYRNDSANRFRRIHELPIELVLSNSQDQMDPFLCMSKSLVAGEYLRVEAGDYIAVYLPTLSRPLLVVGHAAPQLMLYRDNRQFPEPFIQGSVPLARLEGLAGRFLHLQADVGKIYCLFVWSNISTCYFILPVVTEDEVAASSLVFPQSTNSLTVSSTVEPLLTPTPRQPRILTSEKDKGQTEISTPTNPNNSTRENGIAAWEIALIATFTSLVFLLTVALVALSLGIVVYRRWKVEQMKKTLLEIRPAHLAIGNAIRVLKCFSASFMWGGS